MYKIGAFLCLCLCGFIFLNCTESKARKVINVDLENQVPIDTLETFLNIDTLIQISASEPFIASFDKVIPYGDDIFVMDGLQQTVFKISMKSKNVVSVLNNVGSARNEYISITDIAVDMDGNICVYDSESQKINVYDVEGEYLRSITVAHGTSMAISLSNDIAINTDNNDEDQVVVYSPSGAELYGIKPESPAPTFSFDKNNGITSFKDKFVYSTPFDFHVYEVGQSWSCPLALLDFGKEQFDVKAMQGLNLMDTRDVIFKNINKIMYLGNLSSYNDMIFLSTNRNDQLVYDTKRDIVIVLSNVEMPYKILFSSPLFVNKNGQFCSIIPNNNVTNAYLPLIDASRVQLSQLKISRDDMDESENAFWVLSGSVK